MISGRLIALDKQPGIRPVRTRETWWRLVANCLLRGTVQEAKAACGTEQLAGGVKARIEVGIHAMRLLWQQKSLEED